MNYIGRVSIEALHVLSDRIGRFEHASDIDYYFKGDKEIGYCIKNFNWGVKISGREWHKYDLDQMIWTKIY